jgi:hypothetical protein
MTMQRLIEQALAELRRLLVLHGLQEVADVRARLAGDDEVEPEGVGLGVAAVMISTRSPLRSSVRSGISSC